MAGRNDDIPAFRNPRIILFGEIQVDEGSKCVFEPWMNKEHNVFGWDAKPAELTERTFIYIAPDTHAERPQFHLYIGPHGDPAKDRRLGPYDLRGDEST